jgi:hypothetical protein
MMGAIITGALFVAAGLGLSTHSAILESRAAGTRQIPLWAARGYRRPLASVLLTFAAVLLVGIGAFFFLTAWGGGAILLISSALLPPVLVIAIHNRSNRASS